MLRQVSGARPSCCVYPSGMMSTTGRASQMALVVKKLPVNAADVRDVGLIPGSGRYTGGGHPDHSSILAWRVPQIEEPGGPWSIRVTKSRTQLKRLSTHIRQDRQIHGKRMGGRGGTEEILLNGYRISFGSDENVLELGSGEGYTAI